MKTAANPQVLVDDILDRLSQVPWGLTVFLCNRRDGTAAIVTEKAESPEAHRYQTKNPSFVIGTYRAGVSADVVFEDVLETFRSAHGKRQLP